MLVDVCSFRGFCGGGDSINHLLASPQAKRGRKEDSSALRLPPVKNVCCVCARLISDVRYGI